MKKVRFETCDKYIGTAKMNLPECHSPRPFIEKQVEINTVYYDYPNPKVVPYSTDPLQRYETCNSSPYPTFHRTNLNIEAPHSKWSPSNDLELSMLDASSHEPRKPYSKGRTTIHMEAANNHNTYKTMENVHNVLTSVENTENLITPMYSKPKENSFFITRDNLHNIQQKSLNPSLSLPKRSSIDKENDPLSQKLDMMKIAQQTTTSKISPSVESPRSSDCGCHHCIKQTQPIPCMKQQISSHHQHIAYNDKIHCQCPCMIPPNCCNHCNQNMKASNSCQEFNSSQNIMKAPNSCQDTPQNLIDKKTWAIEKYEQNKNKEIQKQNVKEKREPTVSDLFKIIKLQNEQLQLLQDKVDKFVLNGNRPQSIPIQSYSTEHVALEAVNNEEHKISIGVMTSFEMVRTSTVINKEVVKHKENAQIQCNHSQISIKEFVSKQPVNLNFLDGISPKGRHENTNKDTATGNANEEKTLNELSLYNVQIDNATTPLMSPEQTLYLDVRDYSDSDTGSDDHSNVGWTYYNKVMTHVNGMLQDSDMPSSASALYRNTRQQCLQMQIDKTNVSVTKRVKFGDDPLGLHQPHIYAVATDTSLKMNQLAAKYLRGGSVPSGPQPAPPAVKPSVPFDMSFATRNYMEKHKLLQGVSPSSASPPPADIPRFLDITALKRQTKLI